MQGLCGLRILIVEDEFILAEDLAQHFRNVGAKIIGPARDIASALGLISGIDAAVLDINLNGAMVFPLADKLQTMGIPFVFFSGYDDVDIPSRFHFASRLSKPASLRDITNSLITASISWQSHPSDGRDIMTILPKLRLAARIMLQDAGAADRLVERTLEQAIRDGNWPNDLSVSQWLHRVMTALLHADGPSFLQ